MSVDIRGTTGITAPGFSGDGLGKVIQVVNVDTDALLSTTSTAWQNVMSATITPSSSTSKILIMITAVLGAGGASATAQSVWRNSTQILHGQVVSGATASSGPTAYGGSGDSNNNAQIAITGIDAPTTTSATTYYFKYRSPQGAVVRVNDLGSGIRNQTYSQTSLSSITLMEIGA